jgi:hypothetical protein
VPASRVLGDITQTPLLKVPALDVLLVTTKIVSPQQIASSVLRAPLLTLPMQKFVHTAQQDVTNQTKKKHRALTVTPVTIQIKRSKSIAKLATLVQNPLQSQQHKAARVKIVLMASIQTLKPLLNVQHVKRVTNKAHQRPSPASNVVMARFQRTKVLLVVLIAQQVGLVQLKVQTSVLNVQQVVTTDYQHAH